MSGCPTTPLSRLNGGRSCGRVTHVLRTTQDTCLDTEYEQLQSKLVCYASSGVQSRGEGGHAFALPRPLILKVLHSLLCSTLPTPEACSFDKPTGEKKVFSNHCHKINLRTKSQMTVHNLELRFKIEGSQNLEPWGQMSRLHPQILQVSPKMGSHS